MREMGETEESRRLPRFLACRTGWRVILELGAQKEQAPGHGAIKGLF